MICRVIQSSANARKEASSVSYTHLADALRLGEENLYIDGVTPFSGPVRSRELEEAIRNRLEAKGLL